MNIKSNLTSYIEYIKYENLSLFSYLLLIIWAVNPFIEFFLKKYIKSFYTTYFSLSIYIVGTIGFLLYGLYIIKRIKDKKVSLKNSIPNILILILWIISIISTIHASNPKLSLLGESYRKEGLIIYTFYIGIILCATILNNKKYINSLFKIIVMSALFISIMPLFHSNFKYLGFTNIYFNSNHYGYFLMIATIISALLFFSEKKWKQYLYLINYIILLYFLIKNDTFGCYLALFITLIVALIYCFIRKNKILKILSLIILFILMSFVVSKFNINIGSNYNGNTHIVDNNVSSFRNDLKIILSGDKEKIKGVGSFRGILYMGAIDYTLKHPLIGGGFESLKDFYKNEYNQNMDRPHNIILQISSFIGIPGAVIYLVLICFLAIVNLKNINKDGTFFIIYFSAFCYFVSSQFGNSMFYTSPYFMILIGFLISMYVNNTNKIVV